MAGGLMYAYDSNEIKRVYDSIPTHHYAPLFNQQGGALPFFQGTHIQRGQGILGDFLRDYAIPLLFKTGPQVFRGVSKIVGDIKRSRNSGKPIRKKTVSTIKRKMKGGVKRKSRKRRRKQKRVKHRKIKRKRSAKKRRVKSRKRTRFAFFN